MTKQRGQEKFARIPIKIEPTTNFLAKPKWIRIKAPINNTVTNLKQLFREHKLHTVCEEASCPNLSECFSNGIATFMIMGDKCTRRCAFCDVAHGKPNPLDPDEPVNLAKTLSHMNLKYIVITSVDRDDLRDGGAAHFADCIKAVHEYCPNTKVEILVPDFRGRMDAALEKLAIAPPDVFNHNLETVPRLYKAIRPGSSYQESLELICKFKHKFPHIPTKSGLMLGLGETIDEIKAVIVDLKKYNCDRLTLGQYLQPSRYHAPVIRYVSPDEFEDLKIYAQEIGFSHIASGPLVRSSYHADLQAAGKDVS